MNSDEAPVGVLLINLGTPDSTSTSDVRRYLREFLSDPRVLDIHPLGRWALLNLVILPFRPSKSAEAYRSIWTEEGSPLLVYGQSLARRVQDELGPQFRVELAMRYGNPSIPDAAERLMALQPRKIIVVPLFPQYSSAAFGSAAERALDVLRVQWNVPPTEVIGPFFDDPDFIHAFADVGRPELESFRPDHVLFSYHGIPERQIQKSDPSGEHCLRKLDCCSQLTKNNRFCYRAHCFETTRCLAESLGLDDGAWSVSFQSRLGRTPWIKPYTDEVLPELARNGVERVAVYCPAFVADCLETLEEIGIRAVEDFRDAGGKALKLIPSLNDHPSWVQAIAKWVRERSTLSRHPRLTLAGSAAAGSGM
ncbi:MAG: ferrochelatase [Myxococcota bacterium]